MPDELDQLQKNEKALRERERMEEAEREARRQEVKDRITRIANSHDVEIPEDELNESDRAAETALEERTNFLREARSRKWESKVPPRWAQWNLDMLPKGFRVASNNWIAEGFPHSRNLILSGPTGSGKTAMAYAIGKEIYILGHKVKMWQSAQLFDDMRPGEQSKIVLDSVKQADLLVLDDLGSERRTEWVEERLFLVVDYRWQQMLPTIVTTNLTQEQFTESLSERIVSRLLGDGSTWLNVEGKDYRINAD